VRWDKKREIIDTYWEEYVSHCNDTCYDTCYKVCNDTDDLDFYDNCVAVCLSDCCE